MAENSLDNKTSKSGVSANSADPSVLRPSVDPSLGGSDPHSSAYVPHEIDKIILPQSGALSILSASRAPAGEVLRAANYVAPEAPAPHTLERLSGIPLSASNALPDVPALHTFKGDVASTIEEHKISLAEIAGADARRRAEDAPKSKLAWEWRTYLRLGEIIFGIILLAAAGGVLVWSYLRVAPTTIGPTAITSPFIFVDQKKDILLDSGITRQALMSSIDQSTNSSALAAGLVEQLSLTLASSTAPEGTLPLTTRQLFTEFAPKAPDALVRSLSTQFLLGVHAIQGTQPFLIFKTNEYEQAYAGMLQWEYSMQSDLDPLFPKPSEEAPLTPIATTTSSTSTPALRTSTVQVLSTPFVDQVLNNHDTRVLRDQQGTIVLLWSFVDRTTLVITTNADTLQELILRIQKAPQITQPGN